MNRAPVSEICHHYRCPFCLHQVNYRKGSWVCPACHRSFEVVDGIPVFMERPAGFHWGIDQQRMKAALEQFPEIGWKEAVWRLQEEVGGKTQGDIVWSRTFNPRRPAGKLLLSIPREGRVLDIGSGWGNISMNLAEECQEVVALDQVRTHLEWLRAAFQSAGISNITCVQSGDTPHFPFPDAYFDVVILNGVLEWSAVNRPGDPKQAQIEFLQDVARLLKPEGQVYIGIENRMSYRYFKGVREGHIRMRYGALLPRFLTRLYLRLTRNEPFRVYTYTMPGYKSLLDRIGFRGRWFYCPWPHYGKISTMISIEPHPSLQEFLPERDNDWRAGLLGRYFVPSYSMVASKKPSPPPGLTSILEDIRRRIGIEERGDMRLRDPLYSVTQTGKAVISIDTVSRGPLIVQVGLTKSLSGRQVATHHACLESLRQNERLPDRVRVLLPDTVCTGTVGTYRYICERLVPSGVSGETLVQDLVARDRLMEQAEEFPTDFHDATGLRTVIDDRLYEEKLAMPLKTVRRWLTREEQEQYRPFFDLAFSWTKEAVLGKEILLVTRHGDFVPNNCLVDQGSLKILTILDWEFGESEGLPLLDLITFLGRAFRPQLKAAYQAEHHHEPKRAFWGYPDNFVEGPARAILRSYLETLQLSQDLIDPLILMWWVKHVEDWYSYFCYRERWRREKVLPFLDLWAGLLAKKCSV